MTTYKVYYMNPDHFRDGICGLAKPTTATLKNTHTYLRDVEVRDTDDVEGDLEDVFYNSQGEIWSPNGEARELIRSKGLRHTSMSVGDVIEDPSGKFWLVSSAGFEPVRVPDPRREDCCAFHRNGGLLDAKCR